MAITSVGYESSVGESEWSRYGTYFAKPNGVAAPGDLALTMSGLNVTIGPGIAYGQNIVDVVSLTTATNTAPASGTRYDTVCLRRDWTTTGPTPSGGTAGGATTLVVVPGGTSATISGSLLNSPGTGQADHPLYLISITSAGAQTLVSDLRTVHSTAAIVRSKMAMTGPAGTQYILKDGSTEDGTRWVMTLSSAGTVVAAQEWEPQNYGAGRVSQLSFNTFGAATITHNLGWTPSYFRADQTMASPAPNPIHLFTSTAPGYLTSTTAIIYGKTSAAANYTASLDVQWVAMR